MATPKIETAKETLAYCGSCKMDLAAIVVARTGAKIVKVQCKTCKKEHGFKAPKGVSDPGDAPAPKARKTKTSAEGSSKAVSMEAEWTRLLKEAGAAPRTKYTPKTLLDVGVIVNHSMFGEGIVMRVIHPNKAEILFKGDLKILIHAGSSAVK